MVLRNNEYFLGVRKSIRSIIKADSKILELAYSIKGVRIFNIGTLGPLGEFCLIVKFFLQYNEKDRDNVSSSLSSASFTYYR